MQNLVGFGIEHHAVDGEVAALDVLLRVFGEAYFVGVSAVGVAYIGTESGYLDCRVLTGEGARRSIGFGFWDQHYSELLAYGVGLGKDLHDLLSCCVGGYVVGGGLSA